jgi:hypothetical protein
MIAMESPYRTVNVWAPTANRTVSPAVTPDSVAFNVPNSIMSPADT